MTAAKTAILLNRLLLCLTLVFSGVSLADEESPVFNALLIYGNGGIAIWGQNFNEHFRGHLGPNLSLQFTPEFLSLTTTPRPQHELLARSLALKYSETEIDLLIPVLPEANTFVQELGHLFAPDAATLHVLPGNDILTDQKSLTNRKAVVASAITTAAAETLNLMPQLFPDLEHVYVVGGASDGDLGYMNRYRETLDSLNSGLKLHYISGLTPEELITQLQDAPSRSAVLMTTYDLDNQGGARRTDVVVGQLSQALSIPVFGNTDTAPVNGAVGGSMTSAEAYARTTYELVMAIMNGDFPSTPVLTDVVYTFNGVQLDRFGVDRDLLPAGSTIVMDQFNLWRDYGIWISTAAAVIVVQLLLIGLLLAARRRSRLAEAQLSKSSKMEALGTLAGGIAHDFNNILMAISANTELATMQLGDDSKVKERLDKIESASERAEHLVGQILLFSRQSQQQELKPVQICALMDDSIEQVQSIMPADCQIRSACKAAESFIEADANQLHQVFMNLCINAQHAMESKGVIEIDAEEVRQQLSLNFLGQEIPAGHYVKLRITDSGCGINADNLRHVFEPFYTTKPMGKGSGLGLALVYQIIKAHNGYIDIDSTPGQGTSVSIFLPRSDVKRNKEFLQYGELVRGNGERLLLVDDDEMVLDANRDSLVALGYRVTSFASSVAALQYFQKHSSKMDLVLSDLSMPEMDGVRLVSNIRQIRPDIPVILCTGYLDALQSPDLESLQVIKKPFSMPELSKILREALQNTRS